MKDLREQVSSIEKLKSLRWMHWLVLSLSLFLTFGAWYVSQHQSDEKARIRFDNQAKQVVGQVTERMQKYEDALWGGVAAIHLQSENIDYSQWKNFAKTLHIDKKYPGINGIGVIYYVAPEKLEEYLVRERQLRPDYAIHPAHDKKEYWPITYIEPVATNEKAVGLDMAFEKNRYEAAQKARDTGDAQITAPIVLVQDSKKTPGFLFYAPFYQGDIVPETLEERREKFIGMVYAPFITYRLMEGTLKKENRLVNIRLRDGDEVIYDEFSGEVEEVDLHPVFTRTVDLSMNGRQWKVDIRADLSFNSLVENNQPKIILVGGLLLNILLLWVFLLLTQSNKRATDLALRMTKDLREVNLELVESRDAISKAVEGISRIDPEGRYIKLNAAYAGIAGYVPEELEGENWSKTVHPDDMPMLEEAYADMLRDGKVAAEARGIRKDGSVFYKRVTMLSQYDDEGSFVGHHCFMQDITERKKNEEALKVLNQKLGLILDNVGEGIYSLDLEGNTTSANRAAVELLGYSLKEMLGVSQYKLIHHHHADGSDYIKEDCNIYAAFKDGRTHTTDKEVFWKKDGTMLPIEYTSKPILDENKTITGAVVVFRDISERKQQEEERDNLTKELLESNTELERFAYIASHDMQEPIRMVTNFSEIISKDYGDKLDDTGKEYLSMIVNAGVRMRDLVEDLLSYSRVGNEGMNRTSFDANNALKGVLENLHGLIQEQKAEITHGELPKMYGNPVQIMCLLQNLITNGIKYQAKGSTPEIHISAEEDDDEWRILVKDNGMGIKAEFSEQIFQPFRRLHTWDSINGTGLGLSICKKIVESHGGRIWVTSELGEGSVFGISISKKQN